MSYTFNQRSDIDATIEMVRQPTKAVTGVDPFRQNNSAPLTVGYLFQTPSGGIAARSGTTCGSAACTPYYIDSTGEIAELTDNDGASQTITVYNVFGSAIAGSAYITAKRVFGQLVADAEDCA